MSPAPEQRKNKKEQEVARVDNMTNYKPVPPLSPNQEHAFWEKVRVDMVDSDACWEWTGALDDGGYGVATYRGSGKFRAHRIAYTLTRGPISDRLTLDHGCRNRRCCNPAHLTPMTREQNTAIGVPSNSLKTACPRGHAFTAENTLRRRGRRECRQCRKDNRQATKAWRSGKHKRV